MVRSEVEYIVLHRPESKSLNPSVTRAPMKTDQGLRQFGGIWRAALQPHRPRINHFTPPAN